MDTHGEPEKWIRDEKYACFLNQSNVIIVNVVKTLADYNSVCSFNFMGDKLCPSSSSDL